MSFCLTPQEVTALKGSGFNIREGEPFTPGIHCPGKEPFGSSTECQIVCTGERGLHSFCEFPLMCEHANATIVIREELRGALGSRPMEELLKM